MERVTGGAPSALAAHMPWLGLRDSNSRLGVNTYMGDEMAAVSQLPTTEFDRHNAGATHE